MSMHKSPLTPMEESGLRAHGLEIGTPSQLSDAFRQGVAWARTQLASAGGEAVAWRVTGAGGLSLAQQYPKWAENDERLLIESLYIQPQPAPAGLVVDRELLESYMHESFPGRDNHELWGSLAEKLRALLNQAGGE